ncbi:MAG: cation diffusion facilitator family transporter, partial [Chloroflexi bacterium]|nr:cation diffusion facilitator family transporter [Chloroflexota bacterium]
ELRSEFLISDAMHTRADIFVSVSVMAGLVVVRLGYPIIDTILAVVIAFLIAKIGLEIISSSTRILTDAAAVDASRIETLALQVPGVESCHEIRSRGQEDDIYVDLHIRVAPQMPLAQAHQIAHEVQSRIERAIEGVSDVVIHIEPQPGGSNSQGSDLFARMKAIALELGIPVHHLNAHEIEGQYVVNLHLEVPEGLTLAQAHAQATQLEDRVKAEIPDVTEISTHLEPAATTRSECEAAQDDAQIASIVQTLVRSVQQVHDCHGVSVHRAGGKPFVTLHCTLDEDLPIAEAHDVSTLIEERLRQECPNLAGVTVHVEPDEESPVTT